MDKVVVYPGRFQPMLKHHVEVYKQLQAQYPDADVYIGTSDKVAPDSPFNFAQKQKIMKAHGIDPSRVIKAKNPYHVDSYPFDRDNTEVIFAVGEKDANQRFPANHVKKDGTPGYYQRVGFDDEPLPMSQRGYIAVAPNITNGGDVASASAFRSAMKNAKSPEEAKQIYTKQFGSYDPDVFNLIYDKVAGKTMEQLDLNHMRRMAGLSEAPGKGDIASRAVGQEMTDQQRQLADMGRALMNSQFKYDDELGNKMADVGSELTRFDTPEGSKSMDDMLRKLKMSKEDLLKFMKKAKELVDQGAHEMGRDMAGGEEEPEDEFAAQDADDDAMGAVDDMEVDDSEVDADVAAADDEIDETSLDLGDIRSDYGIEEDTSVCPDCEGEGLTPARPEIGQAQTYCKTCAGTKRKPDSVSYSMVQEEPGISMSNQGAENVTGSEDPHSKNDKHQIPYPYPPENNDQVNQNVKKYNRPTWEIDEPVEEVEEGQPLTSGIPEPYPEQPNKEGPMGGAQSQGPETYAGDQVSVSELNQMRIAAGLEPVIDEVQVGDGTAGITGGDPECDPDNRYPGRPAVNPYQAEVPLDGENTGTGGAGKPNKHYEPPHDPMYEEGDCPTYEDNVLELMRLAGIDCGDTYVSEEPRYEREVQPYKGDNAGFGMVDRYNDEELDPIVNEGTSENIAQKLKDMGATPEDEDKFIKHLFHVSQEMKLGKFIMNDPDFIPDIIQAFKGLDESSWMCTKCGQQPCVGGPACGTMGTDEPGPNNPFPADPKNGGYHRPSPCGEEMSERQGNNQIPQELIDKALQGPDHDAIGPDSDPYQEYDALINKIRAINPKVADQVDVNKGQSKVKDQSFMPSNSNFSGGKDDIGKRSHSLAGVLPEEEGAGCPCCGDGPCNCASDCEGCDCGSMEEAIGDGFLSGNPSLADLLMQLDEMLDQVNEYRNNQQVDEIASTPAQTMAKNLGAKMLRAKNRIASTTGKSGKKGKKGKITVVADPVTAGDLKAYGDKDIDVVADPYKASREESVQETVTNETIEMLRKLAGL